MLTLTTHGAAGTVTGSRHLLTRGNQRILVDCSMFQGPKNLRDLNWAPFPVEPRSSCVECLAGRAVSGSVAGDSTWQAGWHDCRCLGRRAGSLDAAAGRL